MSTINEQTYRKLKQEVDDAKSEAERAKGALDQLTTQLQSEFECEDLKSAKTLLADLETKKEKAQRTFEKAMTDYEKKWKEQE